MTEQQQWSKQAVVSFLLVFGSPLVAGIARRLVGIAQVEEAFLLGMPVGMLLGLSTWLTLRKVPKERRLRGMGLATAVVIVDAFVGLILLLVGLRGSLAD